MRLAIWNTTTFSRTLLGPSAPGSSPPWPASMAIIILRFFFLMLQFDLHLLLTDDPYFTFEEVRRETLGIFCGCFYLFYLVIKDKQPTLKEIVISGVPLFYTGNRTMIFAFILVMFVVYVSKLTFKKILLIISGRIFSGGDNQIP